MRVTELNQAAAKVTLWHICTVFPSFCFFHQSCAGLQLFTRKHYWEVNFYFTDSIFYTLLFYGNKSFDKTLFAWCVLGRYIFLLLSPTSSWTLLVPVSYSAEQEVCRAETVSDHDKLCRQSSRLSSVAELLCWQVTNKENTHTLWEQLKCPHNTFC